MKDLTHICGYAPMIKYPPCMMPIYLYCSVVIIRTEMFSILLQTIIMYECGAFRISMESYQ